MCGGSHQSKMPTALVVYPAIVQHGSELVDSMDSDCKTALDRDRENDTCCRRVSAADGSILQPASSVVSTESTLN
jgi:hypothetical protein